MPANPWHHERRTRIPRTAAPRQHPRLRCCVKQQWQRKPVSTAPRASRTHTMRRERGWVTAGGFHSLKREEAVAEITAKVVDVRPGGEVRMGVVRDAFEFLVNAMSAWLKPSTGQRQQRSYERNPRASDRTHAAPSASAYS